MTTRRTIIQSIGGLGILGLIKNVEAQQQSQLSDHENVWNMFHGDLKNTGHSSSVQGPITSVSPTKTYDTSAITPSVVDNIAYVPGRGEVNAFNLNTKSKEWTAKINNGGYISSIPAVIDDSVYFGANNGTVYALNAADGSEVWKFETEHHPEYTNKVTAAPCVVDDTVSVLHKS